MDRAVGKSEAVRQTIGVPWDLSDRRSEMVLLFGGVGMVLGPGEGEKGGGWSESDALAGHELVLLAVVVNVLGFETLRSVGVG